MDRRMLPVAALQWARKDEEEESSDDESTSEGEDLKEESEFESESDESADASKQKRAVSNGKPQLVPARMPPSGSPMKRGSETIGIGNKKEAPPSKKKKPQLAVEQVTPPSKPSSTKLSLQSGSKEETGQPPGKVKESVAKSRAGVPSKTEKEKEKKSVVEKENPKFQKKKGLSLVKGDDQKPVDSGKAEVKKDNTAPQKPKKPPQPWTLMEELQLSNLLLRDRKKGIVVPHSKQDNYWEKRIKELPFMEKYDKDAQIVRMHEKVRRMRERYEVLANRIKIGEENVWKNNKEESLYRIWQGIWASPEKEDAEDEDDEDDKLDEEVEKVQEPALKGNLVVALGSEPEASKENVESKDEQEKDTQKEKEVNLRGTQAERDGSESSSEEKSDKEETTPVPKGNAPSSLLTDSQPSSLILVQEAVAPESLKVELHQEGKIIDVDTAMLDYASSKETVNGQVEGSSKQMHLEGLALLEVVRSSCLTMINEARAQSNLMVEEAREKTIQMVDEACAKSVQIMEDLQAVGKKLRMVAGMSPGQISGQYMPVGGVWGGVFDMAFPLNSNGFVTDGASIEEDSLQQQWHEQHTAEQGLVLQRLQLVQEQARIQQEGIRLQSQSLELRKKQSQSKLS
ncbi:hypothetical protein CY35_16G004000 [Sphagnum magellanicum]|nr:hypothetical protein CY35_16G004000 [Sphagnum magellanicum]KAH9536521.1 hypothetical protein CY35_16G004000 [Sphagnum magellanicum]